MSLKAIVTSSLLFIIIIGCTSKPKDQPVSPQEATVMAKQIEGYVRDKEPRSFDSLLNTDILSERMAKEMDIKASSSFKEGVKKGLSNANFGDQIIRAVQEKGSYQLVKQYEKDHIQHLIFRLYSSEGLNYHDIELAKRNDKVCIADLYIYIAGQNFSTIFSDLASTFLDKKYTEKKGDEISAEIQSTRNFMKMGNYTDAKEHFDKLPQSIKDKKVARLMEIQIYSKLDDEATYVKVMEDYAAQYPNDPNIHLLMLDASILRKEYGQAITRINKLDQIIDKDPFLDYYRALVSNLDGKKEEAKKYLETLHTNMPDFGEGTLELIVYYMDDKENEEAKALIKEYKAHSDFNQETLNLVLTQYPDFQE